MSFPLAWLALPKTSIKRRKSGVEGREGVRESRKDNKSVAHTLKRSSQHVYDMCDGALSITECVRVRVWQCVCVCVTV